jgi:hypothetical protein
MNTVLVPTITPVPVPARTSYPAIIPRWNAAVSNHDHGHNIVSSALVQDPIVR